jgi:methyltransferase (TIGR00027 family)
VKKRIEEKTSRTAEYTCSSRAASYLEKNQYYHSDDYIAVKMVPWFVRLLSKNGYIRRKLLAALAPEGIYEYVIARTKYIDEVFRQATADGVEQVLIFGAGFDSRSIRLLSENDPVTVFELDAEATQRAKLGRLEEVGLKVPSNTVYVSVDFNREEPEERLTVSGFQYGRRCLFILEGLLMYLDEAAINETFELMHRLAAPGSLVVFDYIYSSVINKQGRYYGEENMYKRVVDAGEPWQFGFEEGKMEEYLVTNGFRLIEECGSEVLEKRFFTDHDGAKVGFVNGTHSLVLAEVN